eukprot:scaffold108998_cov64-Phaeocystis_antarctica.AAC.2
MSSRTWTVYGPGRQSRKGAAQTADPSDDERSMRAVCGCGPPMRNTNTESFVGSWTTRTRPTPEELKQTRTASFASRQSRECKRSAASAGVSGGTEPQGEDEDMRCIALTAVCACPNGRRPRQPSLREGERRN